MSSLFQNRVCDYFCLLTIAKEKIDFNSGRFKQVGLPLINSFRFPILDFKNCEFPSDLGCFAFPDGVEFSTILLEKEEYSFILTEGDGGRIYCQALRYWKKISFDNLQIYNELYPNYLTNLDINNDIFEPYIMIIVSHWPFFNEFELILNKLYNITLNNNNKAGLSYPIEKLLINLIYEIPLPPRGRKIVEFNCYNKKIYFKRPSPNQLPLRCSNNKQLSILFHSLSLNNILTIIIAMLCEKRILLYSSKIKILTPCIESLCTLIFPFYWQHIYVPVLPSKFTDFIYAPMPFICGVLPSYLPDLSLLEGVVFVDIDQNVVKFHSSDPIPKFQRLSNNRDINKLVSNPKKPLNNNIKINDREIRNVFIKFFAKFLKSYKINMNPSISISSKDKFNKEKWIKNILTEKESDKEKDSKFLNLFVESQLFQCFIEERFDASLNINNYEVLYFDEKIDEIIHNKSTPFLLDTTFSHNKNNLYQVLLPIITDINEPNDTFNYLGFPLILNSHRFGGIRKNIPILVSEEDLNNNQQASMHISWMSVEFFKQKKLYDRHWHSLESKINSQNILEKQILSFFMKWQDSNNKYINDLNNISNSLSIDSSNIIKHKSSLYEPWIEFKKYIKNYYNIYQTTFNESKKKSFIPIMESVSSKENELFVMIQTARDCESMTAKTKCEVEFANKNLLKYSKRLQDKQLQLRSSRDNILTDENQEQDIDYYDINTFIDNNKNIKKKLDDFITAVEQKDKYSIEHVESTTTFLTNLEIFSSSMPTMIDDVKKISKDRLTNFKQYLLDFISSNRKMHFDFANQLQNIQQLIEKIDPEQDIEQFNEGKFQPQNQQKEQVIPSQLNHDDNNNDDEKKEQQQDKEKEEININKFRRGKKGKSRKPELNKRRSQRYSISRELSQIGAKRLTNSHLSIANIQQHLSSDNNRQTLHQQLINSFEEKLDENKVILNKKMEEEEKKKKKKKKSIIIKQNENEDGVLTEDGLFKIITDDHGIDRVSSTLYSDNLWGSSSFQIVLKQCEDGKNVIKGMIKALEDLCDVWELQSKSLVRCCQSMKLNINLSSTELECWKELYSLTERQSILYKDSCLELKESIFELKIMKGELKSINKLLQRKKGELGSEVQFATRNVQLAYDERNACLRIYRQTQSQWKQLTLSTTNEDELKPLLQQMSSAQLNFKQADMKWERSKASLRGVKQKEDLCNGVILDTFREKEINRQSIIILTISHLVSILFKLIYGIHSSVNKFMLLCLKLNVEQEIDSFIDREITSSAAMLDKENIRWTAKSVELSWISSKNAIDSAKAMLDFFSTRVSAAESYSRNFNRRQDWNINSKNTNKFGYSLNDLFMYFNKFIHDLSNITLDFLFAVKNGIEPLLNEIKKCMEEQNSSSHQLISECNTDFNKLEEKLAKSVIECRRLEQQIDNLKQKISEKENKYSSSSSSTNDKNNGKYNDKNNKNNNNNNNREQPKKKKRGKFGVGKIFEKSKEQLQTELSSTQNKLKQEISNRDRLKAQLQQKSKYRDVLFSKVITDFIRHEEYRLKMNKYIYCIYAKINEESLIRMHRLTTELKNNCSTINIKNNIEKFVVQNRSSLNVPKIVLDHAIFKMSQIKNGEIENLFIQTLKSINKILSPYIDSENIINNKLIFNHNDSDKLLKHSDNKNDINSKLINDNNQNNYNNNNNKKPINIILSYMKHINCPNMSLPKMKQVSSNQEISKHLLEYVTRHSMKGGKHARIDSLHSISRGTQSRKSHKTKIIQTKHHNHHTFDENKEDKDESNQSLSNVQRLQNRLAQNGFTGPKPPNSIPKKRKK